MNNLYWLAVVVIALAATAAIVKVTCDQMGWPIPRQLVIVFWALVGIACVWLLFSFLAAPPALPLR